MTKSVRRPAGKPVAINISKPAGFGPDWYKRAWRRSTIDMHIPDWDPKFLSEFDVEAYADAHVRSRAQSVLCHAMSHTGLFNYPTRVGVQHRNLGGRDLVAEMIAACHRRGLAYEVYVSLIFDRWAYDTHPEWRGVDSRGQPGFEFGPQSRYGLVCLNSPYREYVRDFIREICERYEFEGIFFDMTYWPGVCYCGHCQRRWSSEVGGDLPRTVNWTDERWVLFQRKREDWLGEFAALATGTLKKYQPHASVEHQSSTFPSCWIKGASHSLAPPNDFLQGDFYGSTLQGSFARKLLSGLSPGQPYVYATSYSPTLFDHTGHKPEVLLAAKASAAIVDHSAFLYIDAIDPVGTLQVGAHDAMGRVYEPLERYFPELGGERVADIAIYYSLDSKFDMRDQGRSVDDVGTDDTHTTSAMNVAARLLTAHLPFTVITARQLGELQRFKVLIVPNVHHLSPAEAEALRAFVRRGGGLYASGGTSLVTAAGRKLEDFQLAEVFGVSLVKADWKPYEHYLAPTAAGAAVFSAWDAAHPPMTRGHGFEVKAHPGAEVLATTTLPWPAPDPSRFSSIHSNPPWVATQRPEVVAHRFGAGRTIYCASLLEDVEGLRDEFIRLVRRLQPTFTAEAEAPATVEVTLFHQPDRKRHVLGLVDIQHDLPNLPVDGVTVKLRLPKPVRRIRQLPTGKTIPHRTRQGVVTFTLPRLRTLALVAIEHR